MDHLYVVHVAMQCSWSEPCKRSTTRVTAALQFDSKFRVSVRLNHAVQGVSFQLLPLRHLPLSGRLDIALRLGLIHIITLLAKAQLRIHHIAGFQLQLKIQPRVSS
jgi:hypothetical protein